MLPDPTTQWGPFPSIIDGVERPPYVLERGLRRGVLRLVVTPPRSDQPVFGIQVGVEAYACVEEAAYSIGGSGSNGSSYDGGVYIKEARSSAVLDAYARLPALTPNVRHFLFVGGDYCYETLGGEPVVHQFATLEDAQAWHAHDDLT